ncbi:MAG: succinate dehydrogenase, hydrophobic membrane anchor protein [Alphaproteobacteria bacterium]
MSGCQKNSEFVAPLKQAKGLGSAHNGTDHWLKQKITAIANIPLIIWLIVSIIGLQGASYDQFTAWLSQPLNAVLMILLIISVVYHAKLGTQVVAEDYISCKALRLMKLIAQKLFFLALAIACIFSVLKIAFTTGM